MVPAVSSFSTWKISLFPGPLEQWTGRFFKSFVHTVSFLTCQSSFNPTLETLNENHCSVGNGQCEKGRVHQTLSPPCLTYVLGCKCWHRNFLLFESKKFQIQFCCFFHHATLQKYQMGSKPVNCFPTVGTKKRGEQIDSNHHHLCHQTTSA